MQRFAKHIYSPNIATLIKKVQKIIYDTVGESTYVHRETNTEYILYPLENHTNSVNDIRKLSIRIINSPLTGGFHLLLENDISLPKTIESPEHNCDIKDLSGNCKTSDYFTARKYYDLLESAFINTDIYV